MSKSTRPLILPSSDYWIYPLASSFPVPTLIKELTICHHDTITIDKLSSISSSTHAPSSPLKTSLPPWEQSAHSAVIQPQSSDWSHHRPLYMLALSLECLPLCSWPGSRLLRSLQVLCLQEDSSSSCTKIGHPVLVTFALLWPTYSTETISQEEGILLACGPSWREGMESGCWVFDQQAQWAEPGVGMTFKGAPWKKVLLEPSCLSDHSTTATFPLHPNRLLTETLSVRLTGFLVTRFLTWGS